MYLVTSQYQERREVACGTATPYAQAQGNQLRNFADLQEVVNDKQFYQILFFIQKSTKTTPITTATGAHFRIRACISHKKISSMQTLKTMQSMIFYLQKQQ